MSREELLVLAREVALRAYCPYSHFRVGTALVAGGELYTGVNVEISSYGLSLCAERSALVAVACIDTTPTAPIHERTPCGACRQWLADLAPDATIYLDGVSQEFSVADLLPYAFRL